MSSSIARKILQIWPVIVFPAIIGLLASVGPTPAKEFVNSVLAWFFLGPYRSVTFSTLALFVLLSLVVVYSNNRAVLNQYLHNIIDANKYLNLKGISDQSEALISVNVQLEDIFIHLYLTKDRPVYDAPTVQIELSKYVSQNFNLDTATKADILQGIRTIWHSQLVKEHFGTQQKLDAFTVEDALQQFHAENSMAIILGTSGSGKSTLLRWLAFHMATASLLPWHVKLLNKVLYRFLTFTHLTLMALPLTYQLPSGLTPKQIPILLHLGDYAKRLSTTNDLSFENFFIENFAKIHTNLPAILLKRLAKGRCLALLDGLDEVEDDQARIRVAEAMYKFISKYSGKRAIRRRFNRFLVTSRIVGYDPGPFAGYVHYTLVELNDPQMDAFLDKWCTAIAYNQAKSIFNVRRLNELQQIEADKLAAKQRNDLLDTLKNKPGCAGLKYLASNPLMLTVLVFAQFSGNMQSYRRVALYQFITSTLLDGWNRGSGRKMFSIEEIELIVRLLSNVSQCLYEGDIVLTEQNLKAIARQSMLEFHQQAKDQFSDSVILKLIKALRSNNGLLVKCGQTLGQGLFTFAYPPFQEYFYALYLLNQKPEELKTFVVTHYTSSIWHQPLLLALASKSGQISNVDKKEASNLIEATLDKNDGYNTHLHRNLLFAATCMGDCSPWSIDPSLQRRIIYDLFDIYSVGRFAKLQKDIESTVLLWLSRQEAENGEEDHIPPLLDSWRSALCDGKEATRQEGAVHLLAEIAARLPRRSTSLLLALAPPLYQLADFPNLPCPPEISSQFKQIKAQASSPRVKDFAFKALEQLNVPSLFDSTTIAKPNYLNLAPITGNVGKGA